MTQTPNAAMIFAAGFGTRMMPLTKDRPKPLIEVGGTPLIDRTIALLQEAKVTKLVANLHYMADMLESHLSGSGVQTVIETPEILDTGGGLRNAMQHLGGSPVFTVNSDVIWNGPNPVNVLRENWRGDDMDALLLCVDPTRAIGRVGGGDFDLSGGGMLSRGSEVIYGGFQIIRTDRLGEIEDDVFSLNRLWDLLIEKGRVFGCVYPGQWCDVGRPEGIALAEALIEGSQNA
ncbi:nucleotidyltransferase family protein [Aliishimia ponticola]|uniref:Nucleotidyltransferase family protein n=1 Tax=Aliishimia ponticola TaxID=2499833 RepID=A0A4S4N6F0_9RHOB|nr:nucleotidyltransferase family protein [Aliishimia ponticola]THH34629.1 nucleotidyltransferase family protein [Aliishimia ponticola]